MRFFRQKSGRTTYFSNILVSLICTSSLFTGMYVNEQNEEQQENYADVIVNDDIEVASQKGKEEKKTATKKTTTKTTTKKTTTKKTTTKTTTKKKTSTTSTKKYTEPTYSATTGSNVVSYAKKFLGLRYVGGGNSLKTGTDCSGFTKLIYKKFGITLSRTVSGQTKNGKYVKKSDLQKGDLVFYGYGDGKAHHVAIYIGSGKVIHESTYKYGVKISPLNMMEYITARRVIKSTGGSSKGSGSTPNTPSTPSTPSEPSTPSTPSEPSTPSTPSEPSTPSTPSEPSTPSTPSEPSGGANLDS